MFLKFSRKLCVSLLVLSLAVPAFAKKGSGSSQNSSQQQSTRDRTENLRNQGVSEAEIRRRNEQSQRDRAANEQRRQQQQQPQSPQDRNSNAQSTRDRTENLRNQGVSEAEIRRRNEQSLRDRMANQRSEQEQQQKQQQQQPSQGQQDYQRQQAEKRELERRNEQSERDRTRNMRQRGFEQWEIDQANAQSRRDREANQASRGSSGSQNRSGYSAYNGTASKKPVPKPEQLYRNSYGQLVDRSSGKTVANYRVSRNGNIVDQQTGKLVDPRYLSQTNSVRELINKADKIKAQGRAAEIARERSDRYQNFYYTKIVNHYTSYTKIYSQHTHIHYHSYPGFRGGFYYPVVPYYEVHNHFSNPLFFWMYNDYSPDFYWNYYGYGTVITPSRYVKVYYPTLALTNFLLNLSSRIYVSPSYHRSFYGMMDNLTDSLKNETRAWGGFSENQVVVNRAEILPDNRHAVVEGFIDMGAQNWGFKSLVNLYNETATKSFVLDNSTNTPSGYDMYKLTEINLDITRYGGNWENPTDEAYEIGDDAEDREW